MLVKSNIYKRHQIISQQETDTNDNVQLYLGMFFLKRMKCSLQYGHLLCKNLNYYDCFMLYNCIIFLQCLNMSLFWVFFFHRGNCLDKAFSFATYYDYNYYQSPQCYSFSENSAKNFFKGGKLE